MNSFKRALLGATAVVLALQVAPAVAQEKAARLGPVVEFGLEGGFLFNDSDTTAGFDDSDKYGDLSDLVPGDEGGYFALSGRFHLDEDFAIDAALASTFLDQDNSSTFFESGSNAFSYQTMDASLVYKLGDGFDLFGGLRGLHLDNEIEAAGFFASDNIDATAWLVGPRLGADMNLQFGDFPIGVVGAVSGSVLFGSIEVDGSYPGMSQGVTVYNLEGSLALAYEIVEGVSLQAGYRAQQFWGLAPEFNEISPAGYSYGGEGDVLVHGPYAKIHLSF